MSTSSEVKKLVRSLVKELDKGERDPLDISLLEAYQKLRVLSGKISTRIEMDQILNEILESKVLRTQELARILSAPEIYVEKLKEHSMRDLAKLISYRHPIILGRLEYNELSDAQTRVLDHLEALATTEDDDSRPPPDVDLSDYRFETEDAVFQAHLMEFADTIPENIEIPIDDLTEISDFEEYLKLFLYIIILISKGVLVYSPEKRTVQKKE